MKNKLNESRKQYFLNGQKILKNQALPILEVCRIAKEQDKLYLAINKMEEDQFNKRLESDNAKLKTNGH